MRGQRSASHPYNRLTAKTVAALSLPGRYADGGGLYLDISARGSKSWLLRTVVQGRRRDIGLGSVALVSLAEARDEALRQRRIARVGGDPLAERRRARRVVPTFEEAARAVHAAHASGFKSAKHRQQWLASLEGVFAAFGAHRIDTVTSDQVLAALSPDWLRTPETSRRVLQRLRMVFDWAKAKRYCDGDNPTHGLTKVLPKTRGSRAHHAALPYAQLPAFLRDLQSSSASEVIQLALELTILCATRTTETLRATWDEVDWETRTWTIPAHRMKAGVAHRIPISPACEALLRRAQALSRGSAHIFPGRSPKQPLSNMALLMALRRMGRHDITVHGFRSTFRDWCSERTHVPPAVSEAALAHVVKNKTEAAYARSDLFEKRRSLMQDWAAFALAVPAEVVSIRL